MVVSLVHQFLQPTQASGFLSYLGRWNIAGAFFAPVLNVVISAGVWAPIFFSASAGWSLPNVFHTLFGHLPCSARLIPTKSHQINITWSTIEWNKPSSGTL